MGSVYRRGRIWWIKYYHHGQPIRESSKSTRKKDAEDLLKVRLGHIAEGRPFNPRANRLRFEDLAEGLFNDYRTRGLRTLQRVEQEVAHLHKHFAGWHPDAITPDAIRAYSGCRKAEGAANGTINRELTALRRAFHLASQTGKLWHVPHVPMLRENNIRKGFFEADLFEAVRAELPDYLYGVVTFAYHTCWRSGEILGLRWCHVSLEHGEVRLEPGTTKNREGRVIFLEGELREVLETLWERRAPGCEYVFQRHGERIHRFYKAWYSAVRRAWMSRCKEGHHPDCECSAELGCVPVPHLLPHDFRRTAARNAIRAGVPERVVMAMGGWKTRSVLDRYHIVSEGDLRDAAWRIAAWNAGKSAEIKGDGHKMGTTSVDSASTPSGVEKESAVKSRG